MKEDFTMIYDLQKASVLKRISAGILDFIIVLIIATGAFFLLSSIFNYDAQLEEYNVHYNALVEEAKNEFGVDFEAISKMTQEEYDKYISEQTEEEKINYENAQKFVESDDDLNLKFQNIFNISILIITFGVLIAYLIVEFLIPLFFENGQTIGKKIFGICVMMDNGIRIKTVSLFVRAILGKFTIETMLIVYCFLMLILFRIVNLFTIVLLLVVAIMLLAQIIMIIVSKKNLLIHDLMAFTVVVDKESQMIFNTEEELIKYKQDLAAKNARSKKTF